MAGSPANGWSSPALRAGWARSHAVRLAEEGADLILVDICESLPEVEYPLSTREDLDETARLVEEQGRRAVTHVVDIRDAAALSAAVADGAEAGRPGRGGGQRRCSHGGHQDTTTPEQWRTVLDVNLIGTWNTCAAALPHLWSIMAAAWSTSARRPG